MKSHEKYIIHKNIYHPLPKIKRSFYFKLLNERINSTTKHKKDLSINSNLANIKIEEGFLIFFFIIS